jgi:hypothetical protein
MTNHDYTLPCSAWWLAAALFGAACWWVVGVM